MSKSVRRRICVFAAVFVCHALLIWALVYGSVIRVLPDATASIEVRIIQEPLRRFERLSTPGPPHWRRSSIHLKVPSFNIPTPPIAAIQRDPLLANGNAGGSGGVDSDVGAGSSTGHGTGEVRSPLTFESVPNQQPYRPIPAAPLGDVVMKVCVDAKGKVASVNIVRYSGDDKLDRKALDMTRHSRWKVAMVNGKPVFACSVCSFSAFRTKG
jgi:TonB family protein